MAIGETARLLASLDLQDNFSGKVSGILGSVNRLQGGLGQMARGTGQVAAGLGRIGFAASTVAAGGLAAVVKTASDFEQAFTGIEKTVDAGGASAEENRQIFAELEEQFRQMARTIPLSFEELAGIGEAGGALGIAKEDLLDFTDVVARLSVSTNLSSDQAATALGQLGNVLHLSGGDFRDFADSLVALGNAGASTESQIVDIAARFGAAGNAAGLSKEEILALSSAVASMGIEVEAGGSSLSRIFNNVATNIGTSSDKATAFAKTLGLSAAEFRRAWERDALGTFQDFLTELNKLDQFSQARVLKDIGVTNTRDISAVRLMAQNVGFVAEQLQISEKATGDLNKESQKFFNTTQGQWKILINNLRDAGVTIGNELLPVVKDLIKQFTTFLQRPETVSQLKQFGRDLAETIRSIDFGKLIDAAKTAVNIAKTAFDIFNALPGPIKAALIGGVALNRATFGGLGLLLRGAGNIGGGLLSTLFGGRGGVAGGLAGVFGGRGASPANPLFVAVVGPGGLAGGPGGAATAGGGLLGGIVKFAIAPAAAALIGHEIGQAVFFDPTVKPAVEFETGQFEQFIAAAKGDPAELQRGLEVLQGGIHDIAGNTRDFIDELVFGDQLAVLDEQVAITKELLAEAKKAQRPPSTPEEIAAAQAAQESNQNEQTLIDEAKAGRLATAHGAAQTREALRELTLEQRLIRDKGFKAEVDADQFIRILRRTSEFGRRGEGTTIEQGPRTGRDPLGDAFVALTRRLERPALQSVRVQGEISRHITALEQVQGRLLRQGNIDAARHAQRNIDTLGRLIGEVDKTIPHFRQLEREQAQTRDEARRSAAETANHLRIMQSLERRTGDNTGILTRKDFSPNVAVSVRSSTSVSVNDVVRAVNSYDYAVNTYGGKIDSIPT